MAQNIRILVTGGAGYIGSHCAKALAANGFAPVVFDNLSTGHPEFVQWGPLIKGELDDTDKLVSTIKAHEIAAVMHFAASSLVGESVSDPQKYYLNNVGGTLALLSAMRQAGCSKIVFSSTGAVYGDAGDDQIREEAAGSPVNTYGRTKWMIEQILQDYRRAYGLASFCLRYFNACGADASGLIGELRQPETHLIPRALMALQGHVEDFSIFGDDYDTPDGTAVRDYIHVDDLAEAHIAALRLLLDGSGGGAHNLGTGTGYSVREILDAIEEETGLTVPVTMRSRRAGDPPVLVANPKRAQQALRFKPVHSGLSNIIRSAWNWHQSAHPRRLTKSTDASFGSSEHAGNTR
jgi:UDP-glucose 4-epimerase/UDP-arabinose 4-epimerase